MNKEPKRWVVVGTKIGYVVSRKKMTETETQALWKGSYIEHDYRKELGLWFAENFITSTSSSPAWTKKDAQRYCDKLNKGKSNMIQAMLDADNCEEEE